MRNFFLIKSSSEEIFPACYLLAKYASQKQSAALIIIVKFLLIVHIFQDCRTDCEAGLLRNIFFYKDILFYKDMVNIWTPYLF
jgi:hypothetical protein